MEKELNHPPYAKKDKPALFSCSLQVGVILGCEISNQHSESGAFLWWLNVVAMFLIAG